MLRAPVFSRLFRFGLQHHGLLTGCRATCHPFFTDQIDTSDAIEARVVVDGICITSRGPGTALDFALKLVDRLYDKQKAEEVAAPMVCTG